MPRHPSPEVRFLAFLSRSRRTATGCVEWTGDRVKAGYGRFELNGHRIAAHRAAYLLLVGLIPAGMVVMHRCDNPPCVNPEHLRLGTIGDNNRDRTAKGRGAKAQPAHRRVRCKYGHLRTPENLNGKNCKECQRRRTQEWRQHNRERDRANQRAQYRRRRARVIA